MSYDRCIDKGIYVSLEIFSQFSPEPNRSLGAHIRQYDEKEGGFNELISKVIDFNDPIAIKDAPTVLRKMADAIEKEEELLKG